MKKIVFLVQNFEGGGAERVVLNILNNINYDLFEINLLVLENRGIYLSQLKENKNLKIIYFNQKLKNRYLNFFINYFIALNFLKKIDSEVIFSQMNSGKLLSFFKFFLKDKKIIYRETLIPEGTIKDLSFILKILHRVFYRFGIKNVDKIIAQSKDMKDKLIEINEELKNKIVVINNPVDLNMINKYLKEEIDCNFDKSKINLISVGRLAKQKGYDLLLSTLKKVGNSNIHLYVLGTGEEEEKLRKYAKDLGLGNQVIFLGFKENPYVYIKNANFFISSSRVEGFPNAVLEACACGVPVIANNYLGGINEIIKFGINGEIIDISNAEQFQKSLEKKYDKNKIIEDIQDRFLVKKIVGEFEVEFLKDI